MSETQAAFLCYPRRADRLPGQSLEIEGPIARFRDALLDEVRIQSGDDTFDIFMDRKSIRVGEQWDLRLREGLEQATILIALVQPLLFRSEECLRELRAFREAEKRAGRNDLIVPVLYMDTPDFRAENPEPILSALSQRRFFDWRPFRLHPIHEPTSLAALADLATAICATLERAKRPTAPAPQRTDPTSTMAGERPAEKGQKGPRLLRDFLLAAFSSTELSRLLTWNYPEVADAVPSPTVARAEYTEAVLQGLLAHGAIGPKLFETLREARPRRAGEIEELEAAFRGSPFWERTR